jgi:diguanylate cyclase (GGDEF)-like protein
MNLTVRQHDTVARIGGDEFVVVLNDLQNGDDYQKLIDRILLEILQPVDIGHHMVCVGASIGISLSQHSGFDPSTLVTLADKAMYQAKAKGKNQWCIHNHADSNEEITAK